MSNSKVQLLHDPSSIYFLHPSRGSSMSLTKMVLLENNYDLWEKAIYNGLEGKNKLGFINGEIHKPNDRKSPEYVAWRANNSTICNWLLNSIDASIQPSVIGHQVAREMGFHLKEQFSISNNPRRHQLKSQYHHLCQQGMSVVSYFT